MQNHADKIPDDKAREQAWTEFPVGLCQCGCGAATNIAQRSNKTYGHVVGQPVRFLRGHARAGKYVPLRDMFVVGLPDECWPWTGTLHGRTGYGVVWHPRDMTAHRAVYEALVAPVPAGFDVHHAKCRTRACVNPGHMEVLTRSEHMTLHALARPAKTHCKRGHPFDEANTRVLTRGERQCLTCTRERRRERTARERAARGSR